MTMKKAKLALLAFVFGVTLCGCTNDTIPGSNTINTSIADDPMNIPISSGNSTNDGNEPVSFAYALSFGDDYFKAENNKLTIMPALTGDHRASVNVGLRVFVDGMPQYYSDSDSLSSTDMMRFDTVVDTKKSYELTVDTLIDPNLSQHTIAAAGLAYPDYYPKENTSFGNYHKMLSSATSTLPTEDVDFPSANDINILNLENYVMSQEQKEGFGLNDTNGVMDIELNQNGIGVSTYEIKDNSLTLSFNAYSTVETVIPYRVSFYKNHKQIKINDGYDYIDISLEGGKMSQTDVAINDVKSGDFIYCIAAPLISREIMLKSRSTIALDSGVNLSGGSGSDINPGNTSEKTSSSNSENAPSDILESKPNFEISEVSFQDLMPIFSIGDTLYYTDYDGKMRIYSSKNGTDIANQTSFDFEDGRFFLHGDHISCYTVVGDDYIASLYDKELNLVEMLRRSVRVRLWLRSDKCPAPATTFQSSELPPE